MFEPGADHDRERRRLLFLQWALRGASRTRLTCAQAGAADVVLTATRDDVHAGVFECANPFGVTPPLLAGSYTVSVSARDPAMQAVGTAPALVNRVIGARNQITNLFFVTVPITGL